MDSKKQVLHTKMIFFTFLKDESRFYLELQNKTSKFLSLLLYLSIQYSRRFSRFILFRESGTSKKQKSGNCNMKMKRDQIRPRNSHFNGYLFYNTSQTDLGRKPTFCRRFCHEMFALIPNRSPPS